MTASEFGFLALGLVFGIAGGAAVIALVRARPPSPREVRLTVAHDAIPRRATTLADDAFTSVGPEPARGGPADRRMIADPWPSGAVDRRTTVRFGTPSATAAAPADAAPIPPDTSRRATDPVLKPALPLHAVPLFDAARPPGEMVGIPVSSGDDPVFGALGAAVVMATVSTSDATTHGQAGTMEAGVMSMDSGTDPSPTPVEASSAAEPVVAVLDQSPAGGLGADRGAVERCAEERRVANERCELAILARVRADSAADTLRQAQRLYDAHEAAAVTASWHADPRAVHDAKEMAQGGFRAAVAAAESPDALEAAARGWLTEINRINMDAREATAAAAREHAAAAAVGATLERLGLEADAARIGAENADAACLAARVAVADCDERTSSDRVAVDTATAMASPEPVGMSRLDDDERRGLSLESGGKPRIFRLLRGDRPAMTSLVASLAGDDRESRRHWQLLMTGLIEAIVADAIEACAFEFPEDHPFWGPFSWTQDRDIAHALASLGYRFDGLGGWTDERQPSQRDLSLALGYAGLDPMRLRVWPNAAETADLYRKVTVAADEYLAGIAGDLTLAEMVRMLGRRADGLAEIWNDWGRIRPLLLEEG